MPAYMVVEVSVQDPKWVADYQRDVPAIIERFGGRYLTPASRAVLLEGEGDAPQTLAILEYPSMDAAKAMLACPEYQPYAKARQAGATTRIVAIEPRAPKTAS
ncbi:MAG: DUF1330 domain-containing protein [Caulobacterales bacterium]